MRYRTGQRLLQRTPSLCVAEPSRSCGHWARAERRPALVAEGRVFLAEPGRPVVIGSGEEADVRLRSEHVSAAHCTTLVCGRDEIEVRDLGSTNGTRCRDELVERVRVGPGELLLLANCPVLVAEGGMLSGHPDAIRWRGIVARDRLSLELLATLARFARGGASVLLTGESGTGKDLAARALHAGSERAGGPFEALNCASIPESLAEAQLFGVKRGAYTGADRSRPGAFARADGGTLFLDEVGELPRSVQSKLLRVLESGEFYPVGGERLERVDVRVVAATWRNLEQEAASGRFRFDLFQRLCVLNVRVPPLRERPRDVPALVELALGGWGLDACAGQPGLMEALTGAPWPGNVRQLMARALRAQAEGEISRLLPPADGPKFGPGARYDAPTTPSSALVTHIVRALDRHRGNRSAAARELGVSRSTLYRWMKELRGEPELEEIRTARAG